MNTTHIIRQNLKFRRLNTTMSEHTLSKADVLIMSMIAGLPLGYCYGLVTCYFEAKKNRRDDIDYVVNRILGYAIPYAIAGVFLPVTVPLGMARGFMKYKLEKNRNEPSGCAKCASNRH